MDLKEKTRQETPQRERIDENKLCNLIFACCSFHETKAKKKETKSKGQKQGTKRKQKERQEGRKKRERERDREREIEKVGGQSRLRRNKGRHSKINKNALLRGENSLSMRSKKGKKNKKNKKLNKQTKNNKEG